MEELIFVILFTLIPLSTSETFSVKIGVENHVNVVDSRFLSFTIDPKYLFSSSEKYKSKECICMASSLTPAYIRIAGPSTSFMTFQNATIRINELDDYQDPKGQGNLAVSHRKWRKFVQWAKSTGFDLVFALNNEEKTSSGMWDPNTALNILTVAEKANIDDIFWQLGYECKHQSIEEYLNDLETLRVIIETFAPGRAGGWRVVGGDVSNCLLADSKSDFKDYVTLSDDMMDAIMLNGNSSSHELLRMSEVDRLKLLKRLSQSTTPLWLTENPRSGDNEVERAADWLSSLGYSAKNGFSVHFRELLAAEMYEPTLSFYMALLFKNLVGERVLDVELESEQSVLFAHCTSLRHKAVPGAVTIYGANMDDEVARFSIKMNNREEGGDIMQFVIGQDLNGNIVVNGRAMYHEGDIKPIVKRVRPYKTLLINLPSKCFGFWVLANTNIEACQYSEGNNDTSTPTYFNDSEEESEEVIRRKRFVKPVKSKHIQHENRALEMRMEEMDTVQRILSSKANVESKIENSNFFDNLKNNALNCSLVNDTSVNNATDREKSNKKTDINTGTFVEDMLVLSDILDLDNVTEFNIIREDNNKLQEKIADLNNDLDISRKVFQNNNRKRKRNTDDKDTATTDIDNASSSSVTQKSKTRRPDYRPKRRQSLNTHKEKRFENTKTSKLIRFEDNKPNKLRRLKAKLLKNDSDLEGKSSILDNILAKRNARLNSERRKLRLGKNKLSKRNSRITKKRDSSKNNNISEEKITTRFRRSVNEHVPKSRDLLLNNSNETNITIDNSLSIARSVNKEHRTHKIFQKRASSSEDNIYTTNQNMDKPPDHVRIKTLRSGRNIHDRITHQIPLVNHNANYKLNSHETGLKIKSEEVLTEHGLSQERSIENDKDTSSGIKNTKPISHRINLNRSGRSATEKGMNIPAEFFENEVQNADIDNTKLWKILRKIHKQLKDLSTESDTDYDTNNDESTTDDDQNTSKEDGGLVKSTVNHLLKVLRDLNKNLNRFWNGVNLLN